MQTKLYEFLIVCTATILFGCQAQACSVVVPPNRQPNDLVRIAQRTINDATAIIDGEVVQPFIEGKQNAIVRAVRVFKGPVKELYEIGEQDSCSLRLDRLGERRRMLLVGGPLIYDLWNDGSNGRYEDRILKSDRRKVWPFVAGMESSPVAHR